MAILKDLKLSDLVAKDQDVTELSIELKGDVEGAKTYSNTLVNNLSIELKGDITTAQTTAETHADTEVSTLSVELKGDINQESQRSTVEEQRLDDRIDELSSELSNYWKVEKSDTSGRKCGAQMDALHMIDQSNGILREMYVTTITTEEGDKIVWACDGEATNAIPTTAQSIQSTEGTEVQLINIGS